MRDMVFVVRSGPLKNLTLQSIKFNYYGGHTKLPVIECDDYVEGFDLAKTQDYKYAMFVDSGTVFVDVQEFLADLERYPHQGIIGHIIDPLDNDLPFHLHPQAFMLELAKFNSADFDNIVFSTRQTHRSSDNIHDDYTPWWIKPVGGLQAYPGHYFGSRLIARQFERGELVVNFKQILRKNKLYLYTPDLVEKYLQTQQAYCDVAKNQLWVFNNEPYTVEPVEHLVTPASGLFWILHALAGTREIDLVDISQVQIDFARALWTTWDGDNYGKFVSDYIRANRVQHYLLDNQPRTKLELLELSKPSVLIETVNTMFAQECNVDTFKQRWQQAQAIVQIKFYNQDLLEFKTTHPTWMSNVLDYKYTMLKHYA